MAVASLVLGIIAIVFGAFGVIWIGLICGIVGIIMGVLGKADPAKAGMATAGGLFHHRSGSVYFVLCSLLWMSCLWPGSSD